MSIYDKITAEEAGYEASISAAANEICADPALRLVLITGGSCAGKTTTTKKLAALITAGGRRTHTISLDDFYRNGEDAVYLADGSVDIESINSIEVGLVKQCFADLIAGRPAPVPRFSFLTKRRTDDYERIQLVGNDVAIIEGLHALNPLLYEDFPKGDDRLLTYRIYLYADDQKGGDPRFLRRLVRDWYYRGSDAAGTFAQWDTVKSHEPLYIDCFADSADKQINTYFPYERGVLAAPGLEILRGLPANDPHTHLAEQLIDQLVQVEPLPVDVVPENSLMEEFIKR